MLIAQYFQETPYGFDGESLIKYDIYEFEFTDSMVKHIDDLSCIQLDGNELEAARKEYPQLFGMYASTQRLYGDDAKKVMYWFLNNKNSSEKSVEKIGTIYIDQNDRFPWVVVGVDQNGNFKVIGYKWNFDSKDVIHGYIMKDELEKQQIISQEKCVRLFKGLPPVLEGK